MHPLRAKACTQIFGGNSWFCATFWRHQINPLHCLLMEAAMSWRVPGAADTVKMGVQV